MKSFETIKLNHATNQLASSVANSTPRCNIGLKRNVNGKGTLAKKKRRKTIVLNIIGFLNLFYMNAERLATILIFLSDNQIGI
jgi:hypothetical protein